MSKTFGKLFGGGKPQTVATSSSPFSQLPQFGRDIFEEGIQQATAIAEDPNTFRPSGFRAGEQALLSAEPVNIQEQFGDALQTFQNPFEQQVVNQAISDIERGGANILADIGAQASQAGAFGGTRQGIAEAELGRSLLEEIGRASGSLRSQGFQQAADRALASIGGQAELDRQRAFDLLNLGGLQTQAQVAPSQFLLQSGQAIPTSAGSLSTYQNQGILGRGLGAAGQLGKAADVVGGLFDIF